MEDHQWMYTSQRSKLDFDDGWKDKTNDFLEFAWANSRGHLLWCPCTKCDNKRGVSKEDMGRHLLNNGFTKDYNVWIYHGEARRMREEVVRPRLEACDDDAGVVDMLEDANQERDGGGKVVLQDDGLDKDTSSRQHHRFAIGHHWTVIRGEIRVKHQSRRLQ
jgi:hypothetical protein